MGDLLKNSEMLKKLGFNNSNQWIIYDEQFEKFFSFLSENITDRNILTEQECLEASEMQQRGDWLHPEEERQLKLQQLESENPGLLKYGAADVEALVAEIAVIEEASNDYSALLGDMQDTKQDLVNHLRDRECTHLALQNSCGEILNNCLAKAGQLEELQRENAQLSDEAKKAFTTPQMPPLFMHQQPLEQYCLKHSSFQQYFTLFMKDNFKIREYTDFERDGERSMQNTILTLENLQNSLQHFSIAYIKEKAKAKATQAMIDHLDLNKIHCISLVDMARETHDLQMLNENHLKNTNEMLLNDLTFHVHQHVQHHIELVLYENSIQKRERALQRRENVKQAQDLFSDALSHAELVWIAIQLDLEKKRNCIDRSIQLDSQAQACCQRVQTMRTLNTSFKGIAPQFLYQLASQLSAHLGQNVRFNEAKTCLYEYEKFGRLLAYALQSMLAKKSQLYIREQLADLTHLEQSLRPFVFDSPIEQPLFENVEHLCSMFDAIRQMQHFEESINHMRTQFKESIIDRMEKEKLWRYSQLLWIWFLTEPQRMQHAIDEVKKCSANIPALTSNMFRHGGGLQRK
ncbi:augmin complex subunit dgt3 [Drosophila albomicans]|uniref:Augmin complex subunit dgt3 n=1 Tax=Drosophila albomicans TaxID=7291 RepID=A0A6P8XYS1_DROAB|nr:augmin complex subunit dgt3 [Drosophila albomicans]